MVISVGVQNTLHIQLLTYRSAASWDLFSCIVKTGGDLRQEQFATQLIQAFQHIWAGEGCQCWLR